MSTVALILMLHTPTALKVQASFLAALLLPFFAISLGLGPFFFFFNLNRLSIQI